MAVTAPYKQYKRNQRRAVLETDYSKGMMSTNGLVADGYVKLLVNYAYEKDNGALTPRPGLRPYQIIMPDMEYEITDDSMVLDHSLAIKDAKECVEDGKSYYQIVLGRLLDDETRSGELIFFTSEKTNDTSEVTVSDDCSYNIKYSNSIYSSPINARFYSSDLPSIHDVSLVSDPMKRVEFPVGTFAFGNSFYFFGEENGVTSLYRTVFDRFAKQYDYEVVTPKVPSVSEAVTYGYNMLLNTAAYTFSNKHGAPSIQFEGILPYEVEVVNGQHQFTKLMMTPKKNQPIDLVCYYDVEDGRTYDIIWESRETTSSDWTQLKKEQVTFSGTTMLTLENFHAQNTEIMVRVSAYTVGADTIEKAMVVGFDFTVENYGAAGTLDQKIYDLSTATGMESWNGRVVLWGVPDDPTILFISDYNEPAYFPYPNNIVTFDEPIIYSVQFMDNLIVFTTDKIYQVTLADDGNSWNSTIIQSHLSINPWDKHLIQTVRNMLYFKSGNYYYMMVPKAQSLTGELTLAPITTPITSFFDNFSVNVQNILEEAYDYRGICELISYYNFLDYDDIHNIYLYTFDNTDALLYFDVIYNTVDRTWKIWIYESAHIIFPFKHNATETGLLATTSLINVQSIDDLSNIMSRRIVQLFTWDKLILRDSYLPNNTLLFYDESESSTAIEDTTVVVPSDIAYITEDNVVVFYEPYADAYDTTVVLLSMNSYYSGFKTQDINDALAEVFTNGSEYFTFRNFQFLDTGYRTDEIQAKKRYRELQLQINNLDRTNMQFGMEYILDGSPRRIFYKYDTAQVIDEMDPDYGVIYVESTPFLETELSSIDITNQWTIDQDLTPEVSLWKVRIAISGKGSAPRFKLLSRNEKRFELIGINWVSRIMNMR